MLKHYGIKGQKWGVRRFQNEDRTWTEAGKERYSDNNTDTKKTNEEKKPDTKRAISRGQEFLQLTSSGGGGGGGAYIDIEDLDSRIDELEESLDAAETPEEKEEINKLLKQLKTIRKSIGAADESVERQATSLGHSYDYLSHWGIKGQKWGVRRFQNEDGTLTSAGKQRYLGDRIKAFRSQRKLNKYDRIQNDSSYSKKQRADAKAKSDRLKSDLKKEGFDVSSKDTKRMSSKTKGLIAVAVAGLAYGTIATLRDNPEIVQMGKKAVYGVLDKIRHIAESEASRGLRESRTSSIRNHFYNAGKYADIYGGWHTRGRIGRL